MVCERQPKEVLSVPELQNFLRLGKIKVLDLLESGQIPAQKIGTRWRIHRNAVVKWLNKEAIG
jgi:excisionase family DNA binding protein